MSDHRLAGSDTHSDLLNDLRDRIGRLEDDDRKASENIDRIVLIGGTAAMLASVTFMSEIARHPAPGSLLLLRLSWFGFLVGAALAFASFFTTRVAARAYRRVLERKVAAGDPVLVPEDYGPVRRPNLITRVLTKAGVAGFITGALFLVLFAGRNLPAEETASSHQPQQPPFASFLDSLRASCVQRHCVIVFGYDYDLDGDRARRSDSAKHETPSPSK